MQVNAVRTQTTTGSTLYLWGETDGERKRPAHNWKQGGTRGSEGVAVQDHKRGYATSGTVMGTLAEI